MDAIRTIIEAAERAVLFEGHLYFRSGENIILDALTKELEEASATRLVIVLDKLTRFVGDDIRYYITFREGLFKVLISSGTTLGFQEKFWDVLKEGKHFLRTFSSSTFESAVFNAITAIAWEYIRTNAKQIPTENVTE